MLRCMLPLSGPRLETLGPAGKNRVVQLIERLLQMAMAGRVAVELLSLSFSFSF